MLLLGLFLAGLIHVLISRNAILRWLSKDSLRCVCTSAAMGVPIPLCSCSVVPVVAEMRKKGASRSSCLSFLITAPETGADSILVSHAFFGFVAAAVRPVVSFVTAVIAGAFCIGMIRDGSEERPAGDPDDVHREEYGDAHGSDADCGGIHDGCGHDGDDHVPLRTETDDCHVRPAHLKRMLGDWLRHMVGSTARAVGGNVAASWVKPGLYRHGGGRPGSGLDAEAPHGAPGTRSDTPTLGAVIKHIFRYGFVEVADDILFALVVGVALGGVLFLSIPDNLMHSEFARWLSYPVMVLVGVPLYICASASTPVAAALVAKGVSPGAALIFLMTGPATNAGTIAIIVSQFGPRFGTIYVSSVIGVTTVLGIVIDLALLALGLTLPVNLGASESPAIQLVEYLGAFVLFGLIVWRFRQGALKSGYEEFLSNLRPMIRRLQRT